VNSPFEGGKGDVEAQGAGHRAQGRRKIKDKSHKIKVLN